MLVNKELATVNFVFVVLAVLYFCKNDEFKNKSTRAHKFKSINKIGNFGHFVKQFIRIMACTIFDNGKCRIILYAFIFAQI